MRFRFLFATKHYTGGQFYGPLEVGQKISVKPKYPKTSQQSSLLSDPRATKIHILIRKSIYAGTGHLEPILNIACCLLQPLHYNRRGHWSCSSEDSSDEGSLQLCGEIEAMKTERAVH